MWILATSDRIGSAKMKDHMNMNETTFLTCPCADCGKSFPEPVFGDGVGHFDNTLRVVKCPDCGHSFLPKKV
eukprot:g4350.t1